MSPISRRKPRSISFRSNRFVLASTQDLHEKIQELANRVRELEDGLRASHSQNSNEQHPLLSEDLLRIKAPIQREGLTATNGDSSLNDGQGPDVVDSFGSLNISDNGRTKYFGQATSSWVSSTPLVCVIPVPRIDNSNSQFPSIISMCVIDLDILTRAREL